MQFVVLLSVVAVFAVAESVEVRQCIGSAQKIGADDVNISKCTSPPCHLKRKSNIEVTYTIKPDRNIKSVTNTVFARILGLPLPFVGVDNTDACSQIFTPEGEKAGCPLEKGKTYLYKNTFKILPIYPIVNVEVHWALTSGNKDIFCFEVPAKIVN